MSSFFYNSAPKIIFICYTILEIWCMTDVIIFHFRPFFAFYCPNRLKNQNFEKMKKLPGNIIILYRCNINDNNMIYGSWDTECHGQTFSTFWTIFCSFTLVTTQKMKIWKNENKHLEILLFYKCVSYDVWFLRYGVCDIQNFFVILDQFLLFYLHKNQKNQSFKKI